MTKDEHPKNTYYANGKSSKTWNCGMSIICLWMYNSREVSRTVPCEIFNFSIWKRFRVPGDLSIYVPLWEPGSRDFREIPHLRRHGRDGRARVGYLGIGLQKWHPCYATRNECLLNLENKNVLNERFSAYLARFGPFSYKYQPKTPQTSYEIAYIIGEWRNRIFDFLTENWEHHSFRLIISHFGILIENAH